MGGTREFYALERAADVYAALDVAREGLERQIREPVREGR